MKNKFLFVARGPGETGQARGLAKYIFNHGGRIFFALHQKINYSFLKKDVGFSVSLTKNPEALRRMVRKVNPDVILLFNSKMWGSYKEEFFVIPPSARAINVCVDSNWLFNIKKYPFYHFIPWADKYFINIHCEIFRLGLKAHGGNFVIQQSMRDKIEPVGFIPTLKAPKIKERLAIRRKYRVKTNEKLIFSYFSGFGAGHRAWAFSNLISAIDSLTKKGYRIKVLYVGQTKDVDQEKIKRDWLFIEKELDGDNYYTTLSSSDLVFQHQGLVTLTQAISARVPVICNVSRLSNERLSKIHFWEVAPFARSGVCKMLRKSDTVGEVARTIEKLLYDSKEIARMKKTQRKYYTPGEPLVYEVIKKLLKEKKHV